MDRKLRLGKFPFLNCVPIYYGLETGKIKCKEEFHLISAPPTNLNNLLKKAKLDISPISSIAYVDIVNECLILPELSISAKGKVKSVVLFSRVPIEELDGCPVFVTKQSATSVALLKLILKKEFGIKPIYKKGEIIKFNGTVIAGLAIGDAALNLRAKRIYPYQLDLSEIWQKWTGLPFVFSFFVVRKTFWETHRRKIINIWQALLASKKWGLSHLNIIATLYKHLDNPIAYWQCLNYDLSSLHLESLRLFFYHLKEMEEIVTIPEIKLMEI
ncbi:MAG: menaquinone biosynthesis protein [Candidatus Desulfofervidus auxilii]|nr:menaquinone biosynthesis protein [Candidatus Desulfofervidus auxilii]